MRFTLVPSPLLGPATWRPVAAELRDVGHEADVARYDEVPDGPGVLVVHSNAGYWAPGIADRTAATATVYVDAALPADGVTQTPLAPPAFREFLRGLAVPDGVLPPWTRWWDGLGDLFPDEETRAAVEAELPRLPLTWFEQRVPVPAGWLDHPSAYLAFGATYAAETEFARVHDWPVAELVGGHLHMLHDPDGVAAAIVELTNQVDQPR